MISRRSFLTIAGAAAGASVAPVSAQRGRGGAAPAGLSGPLPPSIEALSSMRAKAKPITAVERRGRLEKARKLKIGRAHV